MQNPLFTDAADSVTPAGPGEAPLSVSALNRLARNALERTFPLLRVSGEISNLSRAPSGHCYFTLKDELAQVRCVMWRNRAQRVSFRLENGMQVETRVLVTLYETRGDFQLNIQDIRQAGTGNLFEAFLRLKDKLSREGLFDPSLKRPLPRFPRTLGVVTSPAGAALQDVLAALRRRAPCVRVVLYPAQVQGDAAAPSLIDALACASSRAGQDSLDAILIVRGGGSLEDLWAFNDETLARTIREASVPVVSGIGHETDFTIADLAADARATTPTMAAELVSAGYFEAGKQLSVLSRALSDSMHARLQTAAQRLDRAALQLLHPRQRLLHCAERVEQLGHTLRTAMERQLTRSRHRLSNIGARFHGVRPTTRHARMHCDHLAERLGRLGEALVPPRRERLATLAAHLEHLSPVSALARGFSITRDPEGRIVRSITEVERGDTISVELSDGRLTSRVLDKS